MLTSFAVASLSDDFDFVEGERDCLLFAQRHDGYCDNRSVATTTGFGWRNALDDVLAGFRGECFPASVAFDQERPGAFGVVDDFGKQSQLFRISQICSQQVFCKQSRVTSTFAGVDINYKAKAARTCRDGQTS